MRVLSVHGEFSFVEVLTQPNLYNGAWSGYQGYMLSSQLTPLSGKLLAANVSVISPYATLFKRSCILQGCLPEDVEAEVSFGTWFALVSSEDGWGKVILPSGGYGYLRMSDISYFAKTEEEIRQMVIERSGRLLGYVYSWGGRSAFSMDVFKTGKQFTGLDCSGMVSVLYRSAGQILPRDSSKQALWAHNVSLADMKPGDPFFYGIANNEEYPVFHIMTLFSKEPTPRLFQSADNATNNLPIEQAFGQPFDSLQWGQALPKGMDPNVRVTWGNFFPIREWKYADAK